MCRRRRDAGRRLHTNRFGPPRTSLILIFCFSLFSITQSVGIQIYGMSSNEILQSHKISELEQFSLRKIPPSNNTEPFCPYEIVRRLEAAAMLRTNLLTSIGRILLLRLDEESRIAFEIIYEGLRSRHVPSYDYLSLIPKIRGKDSEQQIQSVLRVMKKISTPYISSYAALCLESLSDGRANLESTLPTDLSLGIDNKTLNSLAIDEQRNAEVPLTFDEAVSTLMSAIAKNRIEPDLELVAALMLNLPNFDLTNPEIPETVKYVAEYMKKSSKPNDPILEYLSPDEISDLDEFVKAVLERILASESSSLILRESVGLLLQNFNDIENRVEFKTWNATQLFDIVVPDFYPQNIVAIAKYFQKNLNRVIDRAFDFSPYTTELQALEAVITQLKKIPSLSKFAKEGAATLSTFIAEKQREEDPEDQINKVNADRALEYLEAFRSPCLPEKLKAAAEMLRPYLNDKLPWNYAFGDTRLNDNPYELLVNAMINLKNIKISDELGRLIDNFIYHSESSGIAGKRSTIYEDGIIFQREDSDVVELDVYSLLGRVPNVFRDKRFVPLLNFFAKPNLLDYLGNGFNMFAHAEPRALLIDLITKSIDKPAVKTDEGLYKALEMSKSLLEEPTLGNKYDSEELENIVKVLPAIDIDPRYLPVKLLFKKKQLFRYISSTFSLAGLETPAQHVALILKTIILKPIHKRLEESIIFTLTNLEGPQLPVRNFNRDDFVYLVDRLFRRDKKLRKAILRSPIYENVSDWKIAVSGTPENVLIRTLNYPVEELSRNNEFLTIIEKAGKILEEETSIGIQSLNKKKLDEILEYIPEISGLRPVHLLLKTANLAKFLPKLNTASMENHDPKKTLIILLENLISSSSVKRGSVLIKRLRITLEFVKNSAQPPAHGVSSVATEELLNPLDPKYEPLWAEFKELNGNLTLNDNRIVLEEFLLKLENDTSDAKLSEAAELALHEMCYGVDSGMIPVIEDLEIFEILNLLPNDSRIEPLKKLLTPSWVLDILPRDFQSANYSNKEEILRVVLFMTKQRPEIIENPVLISAISVAENSLGNWKHDVEPFRKIVSDLKDTLYGSVVEILKPKNLNNLELNFIFDARKTPNQLLDGLLRNLMLHPKLTADPEVMQGLDGLWQDVINFGLDSDLLWVLDDAGIPYNPDLAPVRLFLHTKTATSRLGDVVNEVNGDEERYELLLDLLSYDEYAQADQELLKSITELRKIEPRFENPLEATATDVMDIVDVLPEEIIAKYPDVQMLFTPEKLKELVPYSEIVNSSQPVMTLLTKLGEMAKTLKNQELEAKVSEFSEALGDVVHKPVITGFNLRPLLRELHHAQQINVDYTLQIIDGNIFSVLLSKDHDDDDDVKNDTELLNNILNEILSHQVFYSDLEFENHISSIQRDLTMIAGRDNSEKKLPSDQEVMKMIEFIPNSKEFKLIRHLFKSKEAFDHIPRSFGWKKYPTPLERLMNILEFLETHSGTDNDLRESVLTLNTHLLREYFFISDDNVRMLIDAMNGLSVAHSLIPLRLLLTAKNLMKYLPSDMDIEIFETPEEALQFILYILSDDESLSTNELLQDSIAEVIEAVDEQPEEKAPLQLTEYDLKFILNLKVTNSVLKKYLNPANLVKTLPGSFSFALKPTFKAKVLHLLNYLVQNKLGPTKEIEEIIEKVNSMNDLPVVNSADLEPLVAAIDENVGDIDFRLIKKYLTVRKLVNLLPGDFDIRNYKNIKEALVLLIQNVSNGLGGTEKDEIVAFQKLLKELQRPFASIIKIAANIKPAELKSLISEIPFEKCENISRLRHDLKEGVVLKMLPVTLNLALFKTRKLKLLEILKNVKKHPDASAEFQELLETSEKCVEEMQDVPKLRDQDVCQILTSANLDKKVFTELSENCKARDLVEFLPIAFDIEQLKSYKSKFEAIIDNCQMLKLESITSKIALTKAKIFMKKLPPADVTKDELNQIFDGICCCNFTIMKPLIKFLATKDLRSFLPVTLNLDKESTVKNKLLSILTALRNVDEFKNKEMSSALDTAKNIARGLKNRPVISQRDIDTLKKLPVMMAKPASLFAKIFVRNNFFKVLPPLFDINDYETERSKLAWLLKYSENMNPVKTDDGYAASLQFARDQLRQEAEEETLDHLKQMIEGVVEHIPLILYIEYQNDSIFDGIKIPHGFEYPKIEDRLRVVLKFMVHMDKIARSKSLVESIESLISKLSVGQLTDYEIFEAINEIPDSDENQNLKIYLRCQDVRKQAKNLNLTPEHTGKQILLDYLTVVKITTVDEETSADIDRTIADVQKKMRNAEFEELFEQIRNFEFHLEKLEAVRIYYILHGPKEIFGADYHEALPGKYERLKKLIEVLLGSPDSEKNEELKTGVEYLNEILADPTNSTTSHQQKTMQDVDMKSLFSVLPKIRSEKLILGLLKFFSNPELIPEMSKAVDLSRFESQGQLMQEIVNFGLKLEKVKNDREQLKALEYVKGKIAMSGSGALPVKLNALSRYGKIRPELIDVLKSVDIRSANLSNVIPIAKFFDTKYNPLIDGRGFDHQAHNTRGTYLKALLQHLIANPDVRQDVKRHAEILIEYVRLDGPGAEPVDLSEDTTLDDRAFWNEFYPADFPRSGSSSSLNSERRYSPFASDGRTDVYSDFRGNHHPHNYWQRTSAEDVAHRLQGMPIFVKNLMENRRRLSPLLEEESSSLKTAANRILTSNSEDQSIVVETRNGIIDNSQELNNAEDDYDEDEDQWPLELVEKRNTLEDGIRKTLEYLKGILPRWNDTENKSQVISGSNKSKTVKREVRTSQNSDEPSFDQENATFSPDKVLVDVKTRIKEAPFNPPVTEEVVYITEEEAVKLREKKHHPIRPLAIDSAFLPAETNSKYKMIPHTVSKFPKKIDLISRKLFVRNDTGVDLVKGERRLVKEISIEDRRNLIPSHENKTVKKDLSKSFNGEDRVPTNLETEIAVIGNGVTDLLLAPFDRSGSSTELTIEKTNSKVESKQLTFGDETNAPRHNQSDRQLTDDISVEDFKSHRFENGKLKSPQLPSTSAFDETIEEKLSRKKKLSITSKEANSDSGTRQKAIDDNYLDIPVAAEVKVDENFHEPLVKMRGDSFRRKRSTLGKSAEENNMNFYKMVEKKRRKTHDEANVSK